MNEYDFNLDCLDGDYQYLPEEEKDYIRDMMFHNMSDEEIGEAFDGYDFD
jgi:hypothetical protein